MRPHQASAIRLVVALHSVMSVQLRGKVEVCLQVTPVQRHQDRRHLHRPPHLRRPRHQMASTLAHGPLSFPCSSQARRSYFRKSIKGHFRTTQRFKLLQDISYRNGLMTINHDQ